MAELRLAVLIDGADLVPQQSPLSVFPAVARDLNLEMPLAVAWAEIEQTVRQAAGDHLETLEFRDDYRDKDRVPPGHKRLLFRFCASLARRHADQSRGRRNPRSDRRRLPYASLCQAAHLTRACAARTYDFAR